MTDRYRAFIVVLDHDMREDDAQPTLVAIKQIKNVISVDPHVADITDHIAYTQARHDLQKELMDILVRPYRENHE